MTFAGSTGSKRRKLAAGAMAALAVLFAEPGARARTLDRDPVPGTPVWRFSIPAVGSVLGPPGGRSYARVSDRPPNNSRVQLSFWWTRAPGDDRWTLLNGQPSPYAPWLLAPDPARPDTVYAVDPQGVVLRSTDAGTTWETRGQAPSGSNWQFALVGTDLFVSGLYTCSPCRSHDGGRTWEDSATAGELVATPGDPQVVYSFWGQAILRSSDGARSFTDVSPAPSEGASALGGVAPSDANTVYALALAPGRAGAFLRRTTDGGASWTRLPPPVPRLTWSGLAVDPASPLRLVILGGPRDGSAPRHLFESLDGGESWRLHLGEVNATALRFSAALGGAAVEAFGRRGLFTTADSGDHWAPADQGLLADGDLLLAGAANGDLYVASPENGGVWRSRNAGRDWEPRGVCPGLSSITADPFDPETLVSLDSSGAGLLWSADGGKSWVLRGIPESSSGSLFAYSLAFDPHRRGTIYAATNDDAWRSRDRGVTWSRLTASLPSGSDCNHSGCFETRDVESIIPDPLVPNRLYGLAYAGYLNIRTEDGGATWEVVRGPFLSGVDSPRLLPDPRIPDRVYWGERSETQVYASYHAGDPPWRALLRTRDLGPITTEAWITFDPQGRLFVAPKWHTATFLRRLGSGWERLRVGLTYEEDVRLLEPLLPLPGGGARLFLRVPGLGLFRADLPAPP